jgi:hypothetical protein
MATGRALVDADASLPMPLVVRAALPGSGGCLWPAFPLYLKPQSLILKSLNP